MIKQTLILGGLYLASLTTQLNGLILQEIDTFHPLRCTFSTYQQNRVAVEKGRLEKAIFLEESLIVKLEEESGQAFIHAIAPLSQPILISLITEKGKVQDLEITFADQPGEVIVLTEKKKLSESTYHPIADLIDSILTGQCPKGYACFDSKEETKQLSKVLTLNLISQFENEEQVIYFMRLTNTSKQAQRLYEQKFSTPCTQWIYLVKNRLAPYEETVALQAVKKGSR